MLEPPVPPVLSACYRAPFLLVAVVCGSEVVEIFRRRVTRGALGEAVVRGLLTRLASEYGCSEIVAEPDSAVLAIARTLPQPCRELSVSEAKRSLLGAGQGETPTHAEVFGELLQRMPELQRLVTLLPSTGRIALSETWRTMTLLAVTLGLAASQRVAGLADRRPS